MVSALLPAVFADGVGAPAGGDCVCGRDELCCAGRRRAFPSFAEMTVEVGGTLSLNRLGRAALEVVCFAVLIASCAQHRIATEDRLLCWRSRTWSHR
jgi:hypothetical protein